MIENNKQLRITQTQIKAFQMSIAVNLRVGPEDIDPILFIAMLQGLQSQIDEMDDDIVEYQVSQLQTLGLIECVGC